MRLLISWLLLAVAAFAQMPLPDPSRVTSEEALLINAMDSRVGDVNKQIEAKNLELQRLYEERRSLLNLWKRLHVDILKERGLTPETGKINFETGKVEPSKVGENSNTTDPEKIKEALRERGFRQAGGDQGKP